jgi:hypothetical protein
MGCFFSFALVMLNCGDDTGGDEVVMMMIYLIDDGDCICMIYMVTSLNSPSVFRT